MWLNPLKGLKRENGTLNSFILSLCHFCFLVLINKLYADKSAYLSSELFCKKNTPHFF